jgi:hypothetical protein
MKLVFNLIKGLTLFLLLTRAAFAMDVAATIAESIKGTRIISVALATIPHDDSMILAINTSAGTRNIIVTKENIPVALNALRNPQVAGIENAAISEDLIQHGPLISFLNPATMPMLASNPPVPNPEVVNPAMENQPPSSVVPESAPSEVAATIASANQQASR